MNTETMRMAFRLVWPVVVAVAVAPLYLFLNNHGILCNLLGCGGTNVLNELFYPMVALSGLAGSAWLSRNLSLWSRAGYLVVTNASVILLCWIFAGRLIHWL